MWSELEAPELSQEAGASWPWGFQAPQSNLVLPQRLSFISSFLRGSGEPNLGLWVFSIILRLCSSQW